MTPSDRQGAGADAGLLADVRDAMHDRMHGGQGCGAGSGGMMTDAAGNRTSFHRAEPGLCPLYQQACGLAAAALAAAGRVLAVALHSKAAHPGNDIGPYGGGAHLCSARSHDDRFCVDCDLMNAGLLVAADLVLAACGLPPEGAGGGEDG